MAPKGEAPLLTVSAIVEFPTGIALVLAPSLVAQMLLGEELVAPAAATVGRIAGVALLAIGAICWLARKSVVGSRRVDVVVGLLVYNAAVPACLVHAAMVGQADGIALWPVALLHTALAFWCIGCLRPLRISNRAK